MSETSSLLSNPAMVRAIAAATALVVARARAMAAVRAGVGSHQRYYPFCRCSCCAGGELRTTRSLRLSLRATLRAERCVSFGITVKALLTLTHKISALITHTPKTHIPQRLLDFPIRKFAMLLVGQLSVCPRTHMPISSNVRHAGLSQGLWVMRASTRISYMG